jgi:hypothetical protein
MPPIKKLSIFHKHKVQELVYVDGGVRFLGGLCFFATKVDASSMIFFIHEE